MVKHEEKILILGNKEGGLTASLVAVMTCNAANIAHQERLKAVTSSLFPAWIDSFTEHYQFNSKGNNLDQKSFDPVDPQSQPMQIVPRRGVPQTNDE